MELEGGSNGGQQHQHHPRFADDFDSNCSSPYASAPSSPGRGPALASGYYFSAPASPMHYVLSSAPYSVAGSPSSSPPATGSTSTEFEFSSELPSVGTVPTGSMSSADELFYNGQIRSMKLSSHLQRPQALAPLVDVDVEEDEEGEVKTEAIEARGRDRMNRSLHRRARSMSPLRKSRFQWRDDEEHEGKGKERIDLDLEVDLDAKQTEEAATTTQSDSASSSRSSSSGRNSKRWIFLKDLLYRSKSEGRGTSSIKEKFWHNLSFSPSASKAKPSPPGDALPRRHKGAAAAPAGASSKKKPTNGLGKRRGPAPAPSAHERHYTANRAAAEELRKRTFLPYRQGLLGCLGFSSRGYGAVNGIARALNPISSRYMKVDAF